MKRSKNWWNVDDFITLNVKIHAYCHLQNSWNSFSDKIPFWFWNSHLNTKFNGLKSKFNRNICHWAKISKTFIWKKKKIIWKNRVEVYWIWFSDHMNIVDTHEMQFFCPFYSTKDLEIQSLVPDIKMYKLHSVLSVRIRWHL